MSADLWKEFGSSDQELPTNPWRQPLDISLQAEKSDFEIPAALPLTQASEFREGSITDAICTFRTREDHNHRVKSSQSVHEPQHRKVSSLGGCEITDRASAVNKSNISIQRKSEAKEAFPKTVEFSHPLRRRATPIRADTQAPDRDDEWGDFVEGSSAEPADSTSVEGKNPPKLESSQNFQALLCSSPPFGQLHPLEEVDIASTAVISTSGNLEQLMKASPQGPSPSNIPPPSILLLLITSIFQSLSGDFKNYDLQAGLSSNASSTVDQQSISKLRRRLAIIRASARVIAGRKLRWSRDGHLSQSMKIGPAQGGRAGGMKLTVLDRTETRREDREVEEAIQTWKRQLGSLRALSAVIRTQESDYSLAVPELAEKMPIRVVKFPEGGMTAAKCCFLCGLKRDERIEKVDIHVEDSFGEWWIDHWGHVDCVIFWDEQKNNLQQR